MAREADDVVLEGAAAVLYDSMRQLIDRQDDGMTLMTMTQDMVGELLRRDCDSVLRERTLGEVSRFFLGVMKASDLSRQYRINRLRSFARSTVKLLLRSRPATNACQPVRPYGGPDRRAVGGAELLQ